MSDTTASNDLRYLPSSAGKRWAVPNVSSGWVIMLLSGLIATLIFFVVTSQQGSKNSVVVLTEHIEPGQVVPASAFKEVKISIDKAQLDHLVTFNNKSKYEGWVAAAALEPGDLLSTSALRQTAAPEGNRSMSIPIERTHAVGGDLRAGDRVDIIDSSNTPSSYVAQNVQVLSVDNSDKNALSGSGSFSVTVAVDANQAIRLSQTIKANKFDIIKSTGAQPISPGDTPSGAVK